MKTIDEIIDDIIQREGGYNDIKEDKGGATNFGISLRYASGIGLDLDNDGDVDKDDIRIVSIETIRMSSLSTSPSLSRSRPIPLAYLRLMPKLVAPPLSSLISLYPPSRCIISSIISSIVFI